MFNLLEMINDPETRIRASDLDRDLSKKGICLGMRKLCHNFHGMMPMSVVQTPLSKHQKYSPA